jgi:hypothetical protein
MTNDRDHGFQGIVNAWQMPWGSPLEILQWCNILRAMKHEQLKAGRLETGLTHN